MLGEHNGVIFHFTKSIVGCADQNFGISIYGFFRELIILLYFKLLIRPLDIAAIK